MTDKIVSEDILGPLQQGLKRAIESYQALIRQDIPSDPKGFTAYHNACKSALMHIALADKIMSGATPDLSADKTDWVGLAKEALKTEEDNEVIFS
ncbi:MAG: hypothetical protein IKS41_00605 [Alphaproteobacteria bacterium]|nr:hypothetical protein [Alphaproteobacteria bacterium]